MIPRDFYTDFQMDFTIWGSPGRDPRAGQIDKINIANKKSKIDIWSKNLIASKINEKTIPTVVIIATIEHKINNVTLDFSTACLALNLKDIFFNDTKQSNELIAIIPHRK